MEARIRFFLWRGQLTLSEGQIEELNTQSGSWDWNARCAWMKLNGDAAGLPPETGFLFWDLQKQNFYIQEANGKKVPYGCDGFERPDYLPGPAKYLISSVDATIYFESIAGVPMGEFEVKRGDRAVKVVLASKTVGEGVRRFEMRVGACESMEELSQIAALIRSGTHAPKIAWP